MSFTIDLNDPTQLTLDNVRKLIASEDDSKTWQLRVTDSGIAYLSEAVGLHALDGLAFRLETWHAGNDYVGQRAASDDSWVAGIYRVLKENWPKPKASYIDMY
jgi:hypothetical protein